MRKVFKYKFSGATEEVIALPRDCEILYVSEQHGNICLWALVDESQPMDRRKFVFLNTGEELKDFDHKHIGTVFLEDGYLVVHVFEVG